jgi:hypothetical protein
MLLLDATDTGPYRNYVVPDDGAAPGPADIDALIAAFADRERKLRMDCPSHRVPLGRTGLARRGIRDRDPACVTDLRARRCDRAPRGHLPEADTGQHR